MIGWIALAILAAAVAIIWHVKPWRGRTTRIVTNDSGTCSVHERHWPWFDRLVMAHFRALCLRCTWHDDRSTLEAAQRCAMLHVCEIREGWTG